MTRKQAPCASGEEKTRVAGIRFRAADDRIPLLQIPPFHDIDIIEAFRSFATNLSYTSYRSIS